MFGYNDCEKCPYYDAYIPYWSDDGCPIEECSAGCNPEDGCKHSRLVRWILAKIQEFKFRKYLKYEEEVIREMEEQNEKV